MLHVCMCTYMPMCVCVCQQEMRDPLLQPSLVPLLLSMLDGHCTPTYFQDTLLPLIAPVLEGAQGEVLTALVAGSGTLAALMTGKDTAAWPHAGRPC